MGNSCNKSDYIQIYISNLDNKSDYIKIEICNVNEKHTKLFTPGSIIMESIYIDSNTDKIFFYYKDNDDYIKFQEILGPFSENDIINMKKINVI